jgi:hypothetical protein
LTLTIDWLGWGGDFWYWFFGGFGLLTLTIDWLGWGGDFWYWFFGGFGLLTLTLTIDLDY